MSSLTAVCERRVGNGTFVPIRSRLEFLDGFRTNSSFQQQDRDKLINLTTSLTSFFDHTGITNFVQSRIASRSIFAETSEQ
jgi:hypothetical protein